MRVDLKNGQWEVSEIGFNAPLIFPGTMEKQTVARVVMRKHGDQVRKFAEMTRQMGGRPTPEQAAVLGAGHTGEMVWDFVSDRFQDPAESEMRRADRQTAPYFVRQYEPGAFDAGSMVPYATPPAGAFTRPVAGLMSRLGVERLPGMSRVPEWAGRSVLADTAAQGAFFGAADDRSTAIEGAGYGLGGGLLGKALARALRPADTMSQDPMLIERANTGERLGYELLPSQRTGSTRLEQFEDIVESNWFSGGGALKLAERNQANSNRIVAEALGFNDKVYSKVSGDMLDRKSREFNERFARLTDGQSIRLDDDFLDVLEGLYDANQKSWVGGKDIEKVLDKALRDATSNDGWISAKTYQDMSSDLTREATAAFRSTGGKASQAKYGHQIAGLKTALDDAAERTIGADYRDAFRALRSDYKTFSQLLEGRVINEETGNVNLNNLANILRKQDKQGYRFDRNKSDLYEATRFERSFPGQGVNSLTARRQSIPGTLAASGILGMMGYDQGETSGGIAAATALPASLWLMGRYYHSPAGRRHFGKGLLPPISEDFRRHLGQRVGQAAIATGLAQ